MFYSVKKNLEENIYNNNDSPINLCNNCGNINNNLEILKCKCGHNYKKNIL